MTIEDGKTEFFIKRKGSDVSYQRRYSTLKTFTFGPSLKKTLLNRKFKRVFELSSPLYIV